MTVAHVGADLPFNEFDEARAMMTAAKGALGEPEVVNLHLGRDFLAERRTYGAVVLHDIFHTSMPRANRVCSSRLDSCRLSRRHSVGAWRRRLVSTGAEVIVVLETLPCVLSGWQLGELPGYEMERDGRVTVYRRKP